MTEPSATPKDPKLGDVMRKGRIGARRFEAAETNRLTHQHWSGVSGNPINTDLYGAQRTIRERCEYEIANNPMIAGIIDTKATDIWGTRGPELQLISESNPEWASAAESKWQAFWEMPDANGELSGVDKGRLWVTTKMSSGEFLEQIVGRKTGPTRFALRSIHPRRLDSGIHGSGKPNIVMGVERDKNGAVIKYHILKEQNFGSFVWDLGETEQVLRRDMIHMFRRVEADQARGVPELAPALRVIGDLRDFEDSVLDAQRSAADHSTMLYTENQQAAFRMIEAGSTYDYERQTITTLPAGYKAMQITPGQPTAQYVDYRHERWSEIGRMLSMPLMMVILASRGWNYSSARFDDQIYLRSIQQEQAWYERGALNRMRDLVYLEVELEIGRRPADLKAVWIWPRRAHVDPLKEAAGEDLQLKNLTKTYSQAAAERGMRVEDLVAQHKRDKKLFEDAGIPFQQAAASDTAIELLKIPGINDEENQNVA